MLTLALTTAPALLLLLARAEIRGETRLQRVLSISSHLHVCITVNWIYGNITILRAKFKTQVLNDFATEIKISA